MNRLEQSELIFGRMTPVSEPHLLARYNQALTGFGLAETSIDQIELFQSHFQHRFLAIFLPLFCEFLQLFQGKIARKPHFQNFALFCTKLWVARLEFGGPFL